MATLVLSVAGAAIGGAIGGPIGAFAGRAIGALAGSVIDSALFGQKQRVEGPRLADTKVSTSTYGVPIALLFGAVRIGGNVIWASDLRERAHRRRVGGKGGRRGTATTWTYSCDLAVAFGAGPAAAIPRLWGDGKLLAEGTVCRRAASLALYLGTEAQMPDPTIEAAVGIGNTPAYRGIVYAVFADLQLADFGNRIPLITAEIAGPPRSAGGVIGALAGRAGVGSQVCVASLGEPVAGYSIARAVSARAAIEEIAFAFGAEGSQVPGGVVMRRRGQGATGGLDYDQIGCAENDPPEDDRIVVARGEEAALPREVTFTFADPARDYQENTARSFRQAGRGEGKVAVELPLVLAAADAKARAEQIHRDLWASRSTVERIGLPPRFNAVQAGDRFDVRLASGWQRLALTRVAVGANGLVEAAAVLEQPETWLPHAAPADSGTVPGNLAPQIVPTIAHLLDLPMLAAQDDDAGFYAALGGGAGWRLAELYRSPDGVDFAFLLASDLAAVLGTATNALGSGPAAIMDHANTLNVTLANPSHELESVTFDALLRGANAALVGGEIIQFQTATLAGPGQYVLSGLLRGRLGTDDAIAGHAPGARFVLLDGTEAIARVRDGLALAGVVNTYRAVSLHQPFGDAAPFSFTNSARSLRPYAVVHLAGARDGAGNLTITWHRRTRVPSPWADGADAPLGETAERYEIDIRNAADTATLRTLAVTTPGAVYSAAEQTADFGSVQGSVRVRVFQISGTVGRGIMRGAIL
jgi:hypothetical protein